MKNLILVLLFLLFSTGNIFADYNGGTRGTRISLTTTTYNAGTSKLVKLGEAELWSVNFIATSSNGNFYIVDALTDTTSSGTGYADIKSEGQEATSGNTYTRDYGNNPLKLSTGLYVVVNNGYLVVTYD